MFFCDLIPTFSCVFNAERSAFCRCSKLLSGNYELLYLAFCGVLATKSIRSRYDFFKQFRFLRFGHTVFDFPIYVYVQSHENVGFRLL